MERIRQRAVQDKVKNVKVNKTVQRMKIKSSAKGDNKIAKEKRYAVKLEFSELIKTTELSPQQIQVIEASGYFFDRT